MKKLFTLTTLFLSLTVSVQAQAIRKTWDFRNGFSATTITNLNTDMQQNGATGNTSNWRNWEKVPPRLLMRVSGVQTTERPSMTTETV